MKRKVWALIMGNFRQEFELYTTISYLCDLRRTGVVDEILISTWEGEADRIPHLRDRFKELGIYLVEAPEPMESISYTDMSYLRQAAQMKNALACVPNESVVLKCRSDFSNFDFNRMDALNEGLLSKNINGFGSFSCGLNHKISVLCYGISCPFTLYDVTFWGDREDLEKLSSSENSLYSIGSVMWVDIWIFAPYFVRKYQIFEDFYRCIEHRAFASAMYSWRPEDDAVLPRALVKFYALYFVILYQGFTIFHEEALPDEVHLSLADVFGKRDDNYIRKNGYVEIRNEKIVDLVVNGGLEMTPGYRTLYDEINHIKEAGYAESLSITRDDYDELIEWGRKEFGLELESWLLPYHRITPSGVTYDLDFDEASKILFSDYNVDADVLSEIKDISHDAKGYYNHLVASLPVFEKADFSLYKKALFNASRYANDTVIRRIAGLLLTGELNDTERDEALYPFKRYAYEDRLYGFPMSEERIKGLYDYCLYEKDNEEEPVIRREWYRRLLLERDGAADISDREITMDDLDAILKEQGHR